MRCLQPAFIHGDATSQVRHPGARRRDGQVELVAAREGGHGVDDLDVAGAPADVARERFLDRLRVVGAPAADVRLGRDHHPRGAEAALRGVVVRERLLHGRQRLRRPEPFDRGHLGAGDRADGREARPARLAVDEDGAGAAASLLAAGLRARDRELLAEDVEQRRERRARDLVRDAVDRQVHEASSSWERTRRTSTGRARDRYQADASASSPSSTSSSAAAAGCLGIRRGRLGGREPPAVAGEARRGQPDGAVLRADARHREHRVLVRVRVVERGEGRCRRLLEADVEQEPAVPRVEELLQRLRALAASAGRARRCAEREERALEIASGRVRALAGAEIPADRRLPADLDVGDVQCALREGGNGVGELGEPADRHACADRHGRPVVVDRVEPGPAEHERPAGGEPSVRDLRDDDRAARDHRDPRPVAELGDRLVDRGGEQHLSGLRHGCPLLRIPAGARSPVRALDNRLSRVRTAACRRCPTSWGRRPG